jgi:uncharacterized protein involved in copper resistance
MGSMWTSTRSFPRLIATLLMLVLALAPFEARFVMAAHAAGHDHPTIVVAVNDAHTHHTMSTHEQLGHDHHGMAHGQGTSAADSEHPDRSDGPDEACCGTFCHATGIEGSAFAIPSPTPTTSFERIASAPLIAVMQGQLQRPPSRLLSI